MTDNVARHIAERHKAERQRIVAKRKAGVRKAKCMPDHHRAMLLDQRARMVAKCEKLEGLIRDIDKKLRADDLKKGVP